MQLTIDNFDGAGARDYTAALEAGHAPRVQRRLNRPAQLDLALVADVPDFAAPVSGARLVLARIDGAKLFTGYVSAPPKHEYLGYGERGPVYRYQLTATGDEFLLDRHWMPPRAPFIARTAGTIVKEMTRALDTAFDTSAVEDLATLPAYSPTGQRRWSEHVAEVALRARASYRAHDGRIYFAAIGTNQYTLAEADENFCPGALKLSPSADVINDLAVVGLMEPNAHVKDYFLGDGYDLSFALSHPPFARFGSTVIDEEFRGAALDPLRWTSSGPVSVSGGKLRIAGGPASVTFLEKIELGGALLLQHGDVEFTAPSSARMGGLYSGGTDDAHALSVFRIEPLGSACQISVLINGQTAGSSLPTVPGRRYVLTTRVYATEVFRAAQTFQSSQRAVGGGTAAANARIILDVHEIDPANGGSQAAPATVLYDGLVTNLPPHCDYLLANGSDLRAGIAFTRLRHAPGIQVASTIPGQPAHSRLLGAVSEGAACYTTDANELQFYPQYVPVPDEAIRVSYRSSERAVARVSDPASIAALARAEDDGVRRAVRGVASPAARTAAECENAALALLDDSTRTPWSGEYTAWSDFLPGGADDIWPGDALHVSVPSRAAGFTAVVREVGIELIDPANDRSRYQLKFANDAAEPLSFEFETARATDAPDAAVPAANIGATCIGDLTDAEVTGITSTTVTIDAATQPPSAGGIEVRRSDYGWDAESDRNLVGRFTARTFTVTRLSRVQTYYLRQYDAQGRYSRYSTALHVDYPL